MIDNLLSKKWTYIIMACLLVLFLREDKMILGMPVIINILLLVIPCLFMLCFIFFNKGNINLVEEGSKIIVISFFLFVFLKMGVNFYIKRYSREEDIVKISVPIDNFISGRLDLIYFYFNGKRYSLRYNNINHLNKREIVDKYNLELSYQKSIFSTYVITDYRVIPK
ncbi:hypothetical protein PG630_01095 [Riemerella anatipestifer]|nr:hypothetical protein [Riemerella anatipestifer]